MSRISFSASGSLFRPLSILRKTPLYHYRIHLSSIVQRYQKKLFESGLALYEANAAFLQENNKLEEYRKELDTFIVLHSSICMLNEWKTSGSRRLFEKLRNVGVICADPVFQESLSILPSDR